MELVGGEFMDRLDYYHRAWLPARALVEEAIRRRFEVPAVPLLGGLKVWGGAWGEERPGPLGIKLPAWPRAPLAHHSSMHGCALPPVPLYTYAWPCTASCAPISLCTAMHLLLCPYILLHIRAPPPVPLYPYAHPYTPFYTPVSLCTSVRPLLCPVHPHIAVTNPYPHAPAP